MKLIILPFLFLPLFAFGQFEKYTFYRIDLDLYVAETWISPDSIFLCGKGLWIPLSATNQSKIGCQCYLTTNGERDAVHFWCQNMPNKFRRRLNPPNNFSLFAIGDPQAEKRWLLWTKN